MSDRAVGGRPLSKTISNGFPNHSLPGGRFDSSSARQWTMALPPRNLRTPPRNVWTRTLERKASSLSAASMFVLYVGGSLLLVMSSFGAIAGLLMVTGDLGDRWTTRLVGVGVVLASIGLFLFGKWATLQYSVQRRR